ncbi:Erythronate-4-phosphate dehydrogenase [Trema orientale]|uniref:glyoxylate reductase (NADP(+)) n=1 Tax=Trema orientale TaxID=63057 RepID=A0A2P5EHY9_TREOI|nr:Erythronate-4-phosphate dehydrogenase [Trema orientale]
MAKQVQDVPQVLVLSPPACFTLLESISCHKFHYLKAWECNSDIPLDQFLTTHGGSFRALVTSTNDPKITAGILRRLPFLGLIVTSSVGLDHIDLPECRRRGIAIANAPNLFSDDVADLAVVLLVDVLRKISGADRYVRRGIWADTGLGGKRVGIVGLGNIGKEVAKRLEAMGCNMSYNSRQQKPFVSYPFYPNVAQLAENNDVLIVCCTLSDQTRHLIDKEVLSKLGRDGVIINVARGAVIDEFGFWWKEGSKDEPHVPQELFALDNVVLSPHAAPFTAESFMALSELIVANLEAFFMNKPLVSPVN